MIGAYDKPPQITSICLPCDRQELSTPNHMFRLILEPTGTFDSVETQRVLLNEPAIFEAFDVGINDGLRLVFLSCQEEIAKIIDRGI